MKGSMTREGALKITSYVLLVLLILVGAYAWMEHEAAQEAQAGLEDAKKASSDTAAAASKTGAQLKAANARIAELEPKARQLDTYKAIFSKVEGDLMPALEAAGRSGKPATRAAALTTAGIVGQIAHGAEHETAMAAFDRALVIDKENCGAILAMNLGGKKVDAPAECEGMMPAAAPAAGAPAAAAKAEPTKAEPAKGAEKAAEKGAEPAKK